MSDYNKELAYIEKDVSAAEKKLSKSKDQLERCLDHKYRFVSYLDNICKYNSKLYVNSHL